MTKLDHPVRRKLLLGCACILAGGLGSLVQAVAKTMEQPFTNGKRNIVGSGLVKFLPKVYFKRIQPLVPRQPLSLRMSCRVHCWDNAVAVSFFSNFKSEQIKKRISSAQAEAKSEIFE